MLGLFVRFKSLQTLTPKSTTLKFWTRSFKDEVSEEEEPTPGLGKLIYACFSAAIRPDAAASISLANRLKSLICAAQVSQKTSRFSRAILDDGWMQTTRPANSA